MTHFTRSNRTKRHQIRNKRLKKSLLHRLFCFRDIWSAAKVLFKGRIILTISVLSMLGFILFALFSPYFSLTNILIKSESEFPPISAVQKLVQPLKHKNLFLLSKKELTQQIQHKFPEIKTVHIQTKWPKTLSISYQSHPAIFNIINEESANKFTITDNGLVAQNNARPTLPTIKVQQHPKFIKIRDRIFTTDDLKKIKQAEQLLFNKLNIIPKERLYLYKAQEYHLVTKRKQAVIWLDLQQEIPEQIEKLVLAEKKIRFQSKRFDHIDLRIPNQIFWEWK
ncbi:hypothetical protein CSB37_01710 [bacterium DOLZORAL124_38_8]|nr:MAG: hypothetical protein CSB37_01710 [bacterium DOLZORAL124_38_8]